MPKEAVVLVSIQLAPVESYVTVPGTYATPEEALDAARRQIMAEGVDDFVGADGAFIDDPLPIPVSGVSFAKGPSGEAFVVMEQDA